MTADFPSYAPKMLGNTCQYSLCFSTHLPENLPAPASTAICEAVTEATAEKIKDHIDKEVYYGIHTLEKR
jgi:hypothetical protein